MEFRTPRGVIVACDVKTLDDLARLVEQTTDVEGINSYKFGFAQVGAFGIHQVMATIGQVPQVLIYDHQKGGNDIPDVGKLFAETFRMPDAVILFPFAGPATQRAWTDACLEVGSTPIVGGEMTHPQFLHKDGGYIADDAPVRIYELAAEQGVRNFVVPGNKPEAVEKYRTLLEEACGEDQITLIAPGFIAQGGEFGPAAAAAGDHWQAVIGRGITAKEDMHAAALECVSKIMAA